MSDLADKMEIARDAQASTGDAASALSIFDMIRRQQEAVDAALPAGLDPDRFVRMLLTEVRRTPKLGECAPDTVLGAMMLAAQTGLEPGGPLGQAYLIPRWSKGRKAYEAQFQIGYKGLIALAGRSGFLVQAHTVRDGDGFGFQYGTDEWIWHTPTPDNPNRATWWWAIAHPIAGGKASFRVIDRNVAERARAAGKAGEHSPWETHYDEMAEKTAIIRLAKSLPLTSEVALAIAADGAVVAGPTEIHEAAEVAAEIQREDAAAIDANAEPAPRPAPPVPGGEG